MAEYFIDPVLGNDANSGSDVNPLATIARAVTLCGMTGSHRFFLRRGRTFNESIYVYHPFTGTAGNRAKFCAYGPETDPRPIWTQESAATQYCLRIGNTTTAVNYVDVEDIVFHGPETVTAAAAHALMINTGQATPPTSVHVRRCVMRGTGVVSSPVHQSSGVAIAPSYGGSIVDCEIYDIGSDGITSNGYAGYQYLDFLVARNDIHDVAMNGRNSGDGMEFGSYALNGVTIRGNRVDMTNTNSKQCLIINHSNSDATAGSVLIEENQFLRNQWGGPTSGVAYAINSVLYVRNPNAMIRRNLIVGGEYGVILANSAAGRSVLGNIIRHNAEGIATGNGGSTLIAGNTLAHSRLSPNGMLGRAINKGTTAAIVVRNNLILSSDFGIDCTVNGNNSHNAFWQVTSNYRNSAAGTNDVTADPLIDEFYIPAVGSPLRGAGIHAGYMRAYGGQQRGRVPTIGAQDFARVRAVA